MTQVIFGYHVEDKDEKIYFWEYEGYSYELKESNYAIVDTKNGIRLVKVVGYGQMFIQPEKKVIRMVKINEE